MSDSPRRFGFGRSPKRTRWSSPSSTADPQHTSPARERAFAAAAAAAAATTAAAADSNSAPFFSTSFSSSPVSPSASPTRPASQLSTIIHALQSNPSTHLLEDQRDSMCRRAVELLHEIGRSNLSSVSDNSSSLSQQQHPHAGDSEELAWSLASVARVFEHVGYGSPDSWLKMSFDAVACYRRIFPDSCASSSPSSSSSPSPPSSPPRAGGAAASSARPIRNQLQQNYQAAASSLSSFENNNNNLLLLVGSQNFAQALSNLAFSLRDRGRTEEAAQLFKQSVDMRVALMPGLVCKSLASAMTTCGNAFLLLDTARAKTEALKYHERALQMRQALRDQHHHGGGGGRGGGGGGGDNPDLAFCYLNYGTLLADFVIGSVETKALPLLRTGLEMLTRLARYPDEDVDVAIAKNLVGNVLFNLYDHTIKDDDEDEKNNNNNNQNAGDDEEEEEEEDEMKHHQQWLLQQKRRSQEREGMSLLQESVTILRNHARAVIMATGFGTVDSEQTSVCFARAGQALCVKSFEVLRGIVLRDRHRERRRVRESEKAYAKAAAQGVRAAAGAGGAAAPGTPRVSATLADSDSDESSNENSNSSDENETSDEDDEEKQQQQAQQEREEDDDRSSSSQSSYLSSVSSTTSREERSEFAEKFHNGSELMREAIAMTRRMNESGGGGADFSSQHENFSSSSSTSSAAPNVLLTRRLIGQLEALAVLLDRGDRRQEAERLRQEAHHHRDVLQQLALVQQQQQQPHRQ